jgi:Protein of unknown function (DUF1580)
MRTAPIEPFAQGQLTLSQAARRLPRGRGDRPVSPATLWRWYRHGLKARDGSLVKLRVWRVGGQTFTSEEALREFFSRLSATATEAATGTAAAASPAEGVEAQLDALGIT